MAELRSRPGCWESLVTVLLLSVTSGGEEGETVGREQLDTLLEEGKELGSGDWPGSWTGLWKGDL